MTEAFEKRDYSRFGLLAAYSPPSVRTIAEQALEKWTHSAVALSLSDAVCWAIMEDRRGRAMEKPIGLTRRQHEALIFIEKFSQHYGYAPSYQEIGRQLGLASKSGVHRIITALEERGHIKRRPDRARSIVLLEGAAA